MVYCTPRFGPIFGSHLNRTLMENVHLKLSKLCQYKVGLLLNVERQSSSAAPGESDERSLLLIKFQRS